MLANDSTNTGDALLWIEQGGITSRKRRVRAKARHSYNIIFGCQLPFRPIQFLLGMGKHDA